MDEVADRVPTADEVQDIARKQLGARMIQIRSGQIVCLVLPEPRKGR